MGQECGRCKLMMAMQKMIKSDKITITETDRRIIINKFVQSQITFKEAGTALGLNEKDIEEFLSTEHQNRYIDENE